MKQQTSHLARWSLIIGIVIVLNMFFSYAISLVYTAPVYDNYLARPQVVQPYTTQESCVAVGGQWTENIKGMPVPKGEEEIQGYCDPDYTKRMQYEEANKSYERNVFIILVALGIVTLIGGILIEHAVLTLAFSWGGVLALLIASMRYWSNAGNLLKVGILTLALGGLIWVAVKKFGSTAQ